METYAKRVLLALGLGILFALIDITFVGRQDASVWNIHEPFFWYVFLSRAPIGFFVGLVGVVTKHPILKFVHMRYLRGIGVGTLLSLGLAVSVFYESTSTWDTFWLVVLSGAFYGLAVDAITTWVFGDGKKLLVYES